MNIHIKKDQYLELKKGTILSIKMGSKLYGCETENSDTDYVHIYAQNKKHQDSLIWTHHNFQYKEDGVDHIFVSLQNFIRNILKGDSTINYECLFSEEMSLSKELSFLYKSRYDFNNYALMRAYLGLVRRDLKQFSQSCDSKKLFHALRGIWAVQHIQNNTYSNHIKEIDLNFFNLIMSVKKDMIHKNEMIELMKKSSIECDRLRSNLAKDFENKKLNRLMNIKKMEQLDQDLTEFCKSDFYYQKTQHNFESQESYANLEHDIKYE